METFTIVPAGGVYRVVAIAEDGRRKVVATYHTEQGGLVFLGRLQEKARIKELNGRAFTRSSHDGDQATSLPPGRDPIVMDFPGIVITAEDIYGAA